MTNRAKPDAFVEIFANKTYALFAGSARDRRLLGYPWQAEFWRIAMAGRVVLLEAYVTPIEYRWCREHRDYDQIFAIGQKRLELVFVHHEHLRLLPMLPK